MSSKPSPMVQDKNDFSREAFYSMLNDSATECNKFCGSANETCFKNCISKNDDMIKTMRDYLLYSGRPQKLHP